MLVSSSAWYPSNLTNVNGTLFFTADDGTNGAELWKSDGTAAGTALVKDIYPGSSRYYDYWGNWRYVPNSSYPSDLTNVNGTLFFTADDGTNGRELWKSDGTAAGTVLVKDIRPGSTGSDPSYARRTSTGRCSSRPTTARTATELWKSDGTAAGTVLVKDICPGSQRLVPQLT